MTISLLVAASLALTVPATSEGAAPSTRTDSSPPSAGDPLGPPVEVEPSQDPPNESGVAVSPSAVDEPQHTEMVGAPSPPGEDLRHLWPAFIDLEVQTRTRLREEFCRTSPQQDEDGTDHEGRGGELVSSETRDELQKERRRAYYRNNNAAGANIVQNGVGLSTAAERVAAAVNVGVDGVEAGVAVSPLAFAKGNDAKHLPAWTLLLASLEDGKTRAGTGVGIEIAREIDLRNLVQTLNCKEGWKEELQKDVRRRLRPVPAAYGTVCREVARHARSPRVRKMCRPARANDLDPRVLVSLLEQEGKDAPKGGAFNAALAVYGDEIEKLRNASVGLTEIVSGVEEKELLQAYRQADWSRLRVRIGLDGSADLDVRTFGFSPLTPNGPGVPAVRQEPPRGELLAWRTGPAVLFKRRRVEVGLGANVGQAEVTGDETLRWNLQPGVSAALLVAFLDRRRVDGTLGYGDRVPKFSEDGEMPPRWVLGARLLIEVPFGPPDFQRDPINSASVLIHSDFIVSDKLKFRIGVPLEAKLIEQEADTTAEPDIVKATGVQWSLPVFATTVLSF
jgi:hypothetical protein